LEKLQINNAKQLPREAQMTAKPNSARSANDSEAQMTAKQMTAKQMTAKQMTAKPNDNKIFKQK